MKKIRSRLFQNSQNEWELYVYPKHQTKLLGIFPSKDAAMEALLQWELRSLLGSMTIEAQIYKQTKIIFRKKKISFDNLKKIIKKCKIRKMVIKNERIVYLELGENT